MVEGLKVAVAPAGNPEVESAIEELKFPERTELIVAVPEVPWAIVSEEVEDEIEKYGLKMMSIIGCSSTPFGATPSWPSR